MNKKNNLTNSGSHSINIGADNNIENSNLHVGDVHNHNHNSDASIPTAVIDRVFSKPISFLGNPVKTSWLMVSSLIGFIGSIASIVSLWPKISIWILLLFCFAMFCLVIGIEMKHRRFIRIPYLPFNFEADKAERLFISKIEGDCPECDGKLKLREIGPKGNIDTYVRCTRNPAHIWRFDFTVLDEPIK